ncbi:hypothetical protein PN36_32350 [Candidatus Thiomargarita nelsonii]|uniref:Uncharacterized protein n=1 Tax=Candidatus Thiomargarita nelsonii TaxID=1003181 RepID=A0A0A6PCZ8_9GAMM|nr:hypothetical protein PN36_32350 [Candidatus Thiomargarita nelsonii]
MDAKPDPDIEKAERLLSWLHGFVAAKRFHNGYINHTQIYMGGLRFVRNPKNALKYMMILERHGHVLLLTKGRSKLWKLSDNSVKGGLDKVAGVGKVGNVGNVIDNKKDFVDREMDSLDKVDKVVLEGLRRIWHSEQISGMQDTLDALDQLKLFDDVIWHDIVKHLAKIGDNSSKRALLNFVAARIGVIDDGWWNG